MVRPNDPFTTENVQEAALPLQRWDMLSEFRAALACLACGPSTQQLLEDYSRKRPPGVPTQLVLLREAKANNSSRWAAFEVGSLITKTLRNPEKPAPPPADATGPFLLLLL